MTATNRPRRPWEPDDHPSPEPDGWFARTISNIPDGLFLKGILYGSIALTALVVGLDAADLYRLHQRDAYMTTQTETPVPMSRPGTDDHVRPYLPFTRPEAPANPDAPSPRYRVSPVPAAERGPMTFNLDDEGRAVAMGRITPGTANAFGRFMDGDGKDAKSIIIHSPGGLVREASEMARAIREKELTTIVAADGYCASSCPLVFAGGVKRVASARAWIGVHQVYTDNSTPGSMKDGMRNAQIVSAHTQNLLRDLEIDPALWIPAMETPPHRLYYFTEEELLEYKLATEIVDAGDDG